MCLAKHQRPFSTSLSTVIRTITFYINNPAFKRSQKPTKPPQLEKAVLMNPEDRAKSMYPPTFPLHP